MRLIGINLWVRSFILLVIFVVIWICISLPDLQLRSHSVVLVNYSISQSELELLGPIQALHEEINRAGNIPWSFSKLNINTEFKYTNEEGSRLGLAMHCSRRPSLAGIKISNNYWQMAMTKDSLNSTDVFTYGAYMDTRLKGQTVIRILINSHDFLDAHKRKPKFCQLWFPGIADPVISQVTKMDYIWSSHPGYNHPFLVTCKLSPKTLYNISKYFAEKDFTKSKVKSKEPMKLKVFPESVSLVEEKCEKASNNLRINYKVPAKKSDFGVCVRWLDFPTQDLSLRLIEWIEMMTILGAGGIHFHLFAVHPNVLKVLKHYEKLGFVTTKEFSLPGYQPNFPQMRHEFIYLNPNNTYNYREPMWRQEVIPLNDCFYTHMYTYKHIAAIDIDEVILPVKGQKWKDLLTELKISAADTPCFTMVTFTENKIEPNLSYLPVFNLSSEKSVTNHVNGSSPYMMTQVYSPAACNTYPKSHAKCFFSTKNILRVYMHRPLDCLQKAKEIKTCSVTLDTKFAYVHHHKKVCNLKWVDYNKTKDKFKSDFTIRRYSEQLIMRRDETILNMNISSWS